MKLRGQVTLNKAVLCVGHKQESALGLQGSSGGQLRYLARSLLSKWIAAEEKKNKEQNMLEQMRFLICLNGQCVCEKSVCNSITTEATEKTIFLPSL